MEDRDRECGGVGEWEGRQVWTVGRDGGWSMYEKSWVGVECERRRGGARRRVLCLVLLRRVCLFVFGAIFDSPINEETISPNC